jgi:L-threonylcarbamoyladenylate synthase
VTALTPEAVLRGGGTVLLPTDTVYGVAVLPTAAGAAQRLFDLKGRGRDIPIAVLVADADQAWSIARHPVPEVALRLAARFWPGALTIVVARDANWPGDVGDGPETVGVRCPDHELVRGLCRHVGPLATSSANRHGEPTPTTAAEAAAVLGGVDLVIDGGSLEGRASTVVDCSVDPPVIIREGAIPAAEILACAEAPA